jgi:L-aminopeptidase/D-esterase-like protein
VGEGEGGGGPVNVASRHVAMRPGPLNLITDVTGLRVGNSHDQKLRSGVTVLTLTSPLSQPCM